MKRDLLILCYHALSEDWSADLSLPPQEFERQIQHLLDGGYVPTTLSGSQRPRQTDKTLVVTFDDGYLSNFTIAAPILERLGAPATLFVPSDYIGVDAPMSWPGIEQWTSGAHRDELRPLDWPQVRELASSGWEIGSHTCSHPRLTRLDSDRVDRELLASRTRIESELGLPCRTVAYPYGDVDERVSGAARDAGYDIGVALPARWTDDANPLLLPRVGVYHGQAFGKFRIKTSPAVRRLRLLAGR